MMRKISLLINRGKVDRTLLGILSLTSTVFLFFIAAFIYRNYQHLIPSLTNFTVAGLLGMFFVTVFTPVIARIAGKYQLVDHPSFRKLQKQAIPLMGGVAIFLGMVAVLFIYRPWTPQIVSVLIGGLILLVLGSIDDVYPLSSAVRLIAQLGASLLVISSGLTVSFMPNTLWGGF